MAKVYDPDLSTTLSEFSAKDADGNNIQQVRKTSPTTIKILPISAWSDVIADSALGAIDQRLIQAESII